MAFALSYFNCDTKRCKDLIIKVLSGNSGLSAKKIHRKIREEFLAKVSYQAVHKALRSLVDYKVLKKFHNEYYLNQEWVDELHSFVENLKKKKAVVISKKNQSYPKLDYTRKLKIKPLRFIPFCLANFHNEQKLPPKVKEVNRKNGKIVFQWKGNTYAWFSTGVCVQVIKEKEISTTIIDFLVERRKRHRQILNLQSDSTKDVLNLVELLNPHFKHKLSYVMSIHAVNLSDKIPASVSDNILKLTAEPGFLGIHDNPKLMVSEEQIRSAHNKLMSIDAEELQLTNIYEVAINRKKKVFASWSNVVFCCEENDIDNLTTQLTELETDLQHLWFYFHTLKNDLRRAIRNNDRVEMGKISKKRNNWLTLWHEFENVVSTEDTHSAQIKEALIKTSKIEKVYNELQNLVSSCR